MIIGGESPGNRIERRTPAGYGFCSRGWEVEAERLGGCYWRSDRECGKHLREPGYHRSWFCCGRRTAPNQQHKEARIRQEPAHGLKVGIIVGGVEVGNGVNVGNGMGVAVGVFVAEGIGVAVEVARGVRVGPDVLLGTGEMVGVYVGAKTGVAG